MLHTRESEFRQALGTAELVDLADEQLKEMQSLRDELDRLQTGNDSLRDRNARLQSDNETLEERLKEAYASTDYLPKEAQPVSQPDINSTVDAVREADGRFKYLRFSPESQRSAAQSQFPATR